MSKETAVTKATDTALAVVKTQSGEQKLALLSGANPQQAVTVINDALQGLESDFNLLRLGVPTSGGKMWAYDNADGPQSTKSITGVLVHYIGKQKKFFKESFGAGGGAHAPDCKSTDGITGFGINSFDKDAKEGRHDCMTCPMNEFGSSRIPGSKGKACQDGAFAFVILANERLPRLLPVPATSLKAFQKYQLTLVNEGLPAYAVLTEFALEQTKADGGATYSTVVPKIAGRLDEKQVELFASVHMALKSRARAEKIRDVH